MVAMNFDATTVAPDEGRMAVPKGWYNVIMVESERKPTQDGSSNYLRTVYDIVDGQYKGMKLYNNFNDQHANPVTREIAAKQFSALMHAVGVMQITDTSQLHNRPMKVKVKLRVDNTGQYDDQNDITAYKPMSFETPANAAGPSTGPAGTPVAGFVPPAAGFTPPPVAAAAAPAAAWAPPAVAPAPAPVAAAPVYEMAPGEPTREQYHAAGWSDEQLIANNKMRAVAPVVATPPAPAPVAAPPVAPAPVGGAAGWAGAAATVAQPWAPAPAAAAAPAPAAPAAAPAPVADAAVAAAQTAAPPWGAPPSTAAPF